MKLYEVSQQLLDAINRGYVVDEETGEVLEREEAQEILTATLAEKVDAYAHIIYEKEAEAEKINELAKRMTARAKALENSAKWLKRQLLEVTKQQGGKIKTGYNAVSVRNTPSVSVEDMEKLPAQYIKVKVERTPDKMELLKALKAGEEINGAELVYNESLQMR